MMTIRHLLGLTLLAATAPAWAGEIETVAPIQAVVHEFGDKPVLAYYTRRAGTCDTVVMTHQEPGPRLHVSLAPDQVATIEDVGGGMLRLTCGFEAGTMVVERTPAPHKAASR